MWQYNDHGWSDPLPTALHAFQLKILISNWSGLSIIFDQLTCTQGCVIPFWKLKWHCLLLSCIKLSHLFVRINYGHSKGTFRLGDKRARIKQFSRPATGVVLRSGSGRNLQWLFGIIGQTLYKAAWKIEVCLYLKGRTVYMISIFTTLSIFLLCHILPSCALALGRTVSVHW